MGNSITFGAHTGDTRDPYYMPSYRFKLYQLLTQAGYQFDFIGSRSSGGAFFPDPQNAGFPGLKGEDIASILLTGRDTKIIFITIGPYLNTYSPGYHLLH
ncbi:MAG: hypothetical protein HC906_15525, partial [Bacteroidales bacterium]|nr:hypothetical protein [Bacteroidales bacterium]